MKTTLSLLALATSALIAQEVVSIEVTSKAPGELTVVKTVRLAPEVIDIDAIIRHKAERVAQMQREIADRLAEIAEDDAKITEAKKLGIEPTSAVADVVEATKAEAVTATITEALKSK